LADLDIKDDTLSSPSASTPTEKIFVNSSGYQGGTGLSSPQLSGLAVGLGFLLIVIFMVAFLLRQKARKNKQRARNLQPRRYFDQFYHAYSIYC